MVVEAAKGMPVVCTKKEEEDSDEIESDLS